MRTILLLSVLALVGCGGNPDPKASTGIPGYIYTTAANEHSFVIWYVGTAQHAAGAMLHDPACPNPIHNCPCDTPKP